MKRCKNSLSSVVLVLGLHFLLVNFSSSASAFYEVSAEEGSIDLRGVVRGFVTAYENPDNNLLYDKRSDSGLAGIARLIMQAEIGQHVVFEINTYQTYIPTSLVSRSSGLGTPLDVDRSSALEWSFSDDNYNHLALDRLNVRCSYNSLDLIIGRQAINLATTFYFTPNDFFAPFAAQTFYRVYKPGVDAARAEVRLGNLSQLSLMSVLGYSQDLDSDTGWSKDPDRGRTSYVGRISTVVKDFELALLLGLLGKVDIIGGSLQGELFKWLGIRAEGHMANPDNPLQDTYSELSVGIEHRWVNGLNLRLEQFYHGSGSDSISDYEMTPAALLNGSLYAGRKYHALGIGYEFTPLLNAEMLTIANLADHSYLISFNTIYSLSDEADLAINLGVPMGRVPKGAEIKSEFGLYPYSLNIEARYYF